MKKKILTVSILTVGLLILIFVIRAIREQIVISKVMGGYGQMRGIATALFDYNTALISSGKEGIFPPGSENSRDPSLRISWPDGVASDFVFGYADELLTVMTTPIQAMEVIPRDPFDPQGRSYLIWATNPRGTFVILGVGPDGVLNHTREEFEAACRGIGIEPYTNLNQLLKVSDWVYAPTNGIYSSGDQFRLMQ